MGELEGLKKSNAVHRWTELKWNFLGKVLGNSEKKIKKREKKEKKKKK